MPETDDKLIQILSDIKPPYVWLPYIILDLYGPAMKQAGWLYTILNRFKNSGTSEAKVGERTLATACGIDRETVSRYSKSLEDLGLIKTTPGDRINPTQYKILLPDLPPRPEIIAEFFPKGWEPPARALKMLKNIRNYLGSNDGPQDMGGVNGGGGTVPPPSTAPVKTTSKGGGIAQPPIQEGVEVSTPEGGGTTPPGWKDDTPRVDASSPQYKYSFNTLKETTTPKTQPSAVVEAFFNLSHETFKQKDPTIARQTIEDFYYKSLNLCEGDEEKARDYLSEKIKVVFQLKQTKDPQAVLWKAILGDWKPRNDSGAKFREDEFDNVKRLKEENEKIDRDNEEARKVRMTWSVEEIIKTFKTYPNILELDRRLRVLSSYFNGNPQIDKAVDIITKEAKPETGGDTQQGKSPS